MHEVAEQAAAPDWRERITGRWAISWQAYGVGIAVNIPLLVLTGGSIGTQPIGFAQLPVLFAIGLVAAVVVAGWLMLGERTWMRHRPVSLVRYAAFHLGSGMIFGVAVVVGDRLRDAPESMPAWARIVITMGIGLWFGITMSLLLEARDRYGRDRARLLDRAVAAESAALRESEAAVRMRSLIDEQIDAHLSFARDRVTDLVERLTLPDGRATPSAHWLEVSESIRQTASGPVRGLSRVLWDNAARQNPAPRVDSVLREFIRQPRFLVGPSVAIIVVGYLSTSVLSFGWIPGAFIVSVLALGAGGLMVIANAVARTHPRNRWLAYLCVLLAAQVAAVLLSLLPASSDGSIRAIVVMSSVLGMGVSIVIPSIVASLNIVREQSLTDLRFELLRSQAAEQAWLAELSMLTREVATNLHGTVQTRLIACSAAIDRAVAIGDAGLLNDALSESLEVLRSLDEKRPVEQTLESAIAGVTEMWEPFCDFRIEVDSALASRSDCSSVLRIVEEGIANAYRHGRASCIDVSIHAESDTDHPGVRICVTDDGIGLVDSPPGLGMTLFHSLCAGQFTLTAGESGGAALVARVQCGRSGSPGAEFVSD